VSWPGDRWDFADHAVGRRAFAHKATKRGDAKTEPVAVVQVAVVEAIDRYKNEARSGSGQRHQRGEEEEENALQNLILPPRTTNSNHSELRSGIAPPWLEPEAGGWGARGSIKGQADSAGREDSATNDTASFARAEVAN
jgi:hypothetical protein